MALFTDTERACVEALAELSYCNPFLPERIAHEQAVLGEDFVETDSAWHRHVEDGAVRPNIALLTQRAKCLADAARDRLLAGDQPGESERRLYEDTALYYLYNVYIRPLYDLFLDPARVAAPDAGLAGVYERFEADVAHYLMVPGGTFSTGETSHMFACFFQLYRAWYHIFNNIIGGSAAATRLRASVWQSIFTCDMRRYRRALFSRMGDITTLVTGPSGTGKELVALAIGLSRYIPFDPKAKRFVTDFAECFYPINLSALSPTLIESELFGHKKGAFTGAVADRVGFFEQCPADGAVFLDEIGELDPPIQVKLLRVLQMRTFQRIGETEIRRFEGKVIAATNRDPAHEMRCGHFRQDLYYRLCSDIIVTPSLREQIENSPEQLHNLLLFITRRVAGPEEAEPLARETEDWIEKNLEADYAWPGNVRELEQCVRNVMVRKAYHPLSRQASQPLDAYFDALRKGDLTADEALRTYCTLVYAQAGNYVEAARRLGLDRRTVRDRVDPALLDALRRA